MNLPTVAGGGSGASSVGHPSNTQGMQSDVVADAEAVGIQDSLIRVPDEFAVGDAPGLVTNNAFAMLAGAVGAISIAMSPKRGWRRVNDILPGKPRKLPARR
jgi:hypothetical protein